MTEEHKKKLQEGRNKVAQFKPTVTLEEFTYKNEFFKRLYYDPEKHLAVFRRSNLVTSKLIAYEVVAGKGPDLRYPSDNDFGPYGSCYTGTDDSCKKAVKDYHGIEL